MHRLFHNRMLNNRTKKKGIITKNQQIEIAINTNCRSLKLIIALAGKKSPDRPLIIEAISCPNIKKETEILKELIFIIFLRKPFFCAYTELTLFRKIVFSECSAIRAFEYYGFSNHVAGSLRR